MRPSLLRALLPVLALAAAVASCTDATQPLAPGGGPLTSMVVTASGESTTLILGRQVQLIVDVTNPDGKDKPNKDVVWASSDPAVATVTEGGLVQGVSVGEALMIATHKKEADTVRVTVIPKPVAAVTISPAVATGYAGSVVAFSAQALDDSSQVLEGRTLTWTTSDETLASVDDEGVATLLAPGAVKVRATADNGVFAEGTITIERLLLVISEVMPNPGRVNDELGEWFEVYNPGSNPVDMQGWKITSNDRIGSAFLAHTVGASVIVPPKGYAVLGVNADRATNGGAPVAYSYAVANGATLNMNNTNTDWLVLRTPFDSVADSVAWAPRNAAGQITVTTNVPNGASRMVVNLALDNTIVNGSNWTTATASQTYGLGDRGTPTSTALGGGNGTGGGNNGGGNNGGGTGVVTAVRVNGASIPVGFQTQLFANGTDAGGTGVQSTYTWVSSNPSVVTVNPTTGLITAKTAGSATLTATSANGVAGSGTVVATVPTTASTDIYRSHIEFGVPVDATPADEFRITREEYVLSYNPTRGGPNWVSWNLNATHFGTATRCNCFTADPALEAAGLPVIVTSDYTGGGFDRGHMVMSDQRRAAALENANTFYLSNILPQTADNNQGPWLAFESYNSSLAESTTAPKELYIVAGGAGYTSATVNNAGKIAIPSSTWKIVVVLPAGQGIASVTSVNDLQVIAINIPNSTGATFRASTWQTYKVSVDVVEALTGYDFLSALPDEIETAVEASIAP